MSRIDIALPEEQRGEGEHRQQHGRERGSSVFGFQACGSHVKITAQPHGRTVLPSIIAIRYYPPAVPQGYPRKARKVELMEAHSTRIRTEMLNSLELTGRADTHVSPLDELSCALHPEAAAAFGSLRSAARADGIDLTIVSAFRAFRRQEALWNGKFTAERPLYDRSGAEVSRADLADDAALVDAILIWSALPGASRHHWGTDFDVADLAAVPAGYRPQLVPQEYAVGGCFEKLDRWLTANMGKYGFFRPYRRDRGGVQPEAWHLSFAPVALPALESLSLEVLREAISGAQMWGREAVLARLPELYERYVRTVDGP